MTGGTIGGLRSRRRRRTVYSSSCSLVHFSRLITIAVCAILVISGTKMTIYGGKNHNGNKSSRSNLSIFVSAIKPIRNLHVTYRGQTYTIREGVSTVNELTSRFERLNNNSSNMGNHVSAKGIVWKGQILKPGDNLSNAGIRNGDRVMILPGDKEAKAVDILAVYLFLLSSNEKALDEAITKIKEEQPEMFESMKDASDSFWDSVNEFKRKDVADFFRTSFDLSYHKLRGWWERPSFRQGLHDSDRIENYRKVITTNLSNGFLKKYFPSSLQKAIKTPELWRREFAKVVTRAIRIGDTVLEGLLDLLLDILKGKGSSAANAANNYYGTTSPPPMGGETAEKGDGRTAANNMADSITDQMNDPSLANNLLFELSESEDDYEEDDL
mmetsp:Transcript_26352/g.57739  ORF Transcript_26352/g.57739 Transcript_26352/m.57739 type:complete len:384 (+) Transcript_26352:157-1308(+)